MCMLCLQLMQHQSSQDSREKENQQFCSNNQLLRDMMRLRLLFMKEVLSIRPCSVLIPIHYGCIILIYISQPLGVETTANHQTGRYLFFFCLPGSALWGCPHWKCLPPEIKKHSLPLIQRDKDVQFHWVNNKSITKSLNILQDMSPVRAIPGHDLESQVK